MPKSSRAFAGLSVVLGCVAMVSVGGALAVIGRPTTNSAPQPTPSAPIAAAALNVPPELFEVIERSAFLALPPEHQAMIANLAGTRDQAHDPVAVCFAPGTDPAVMDAVNAAIVGFRPRFVNTTRWGATAISASASNGNPVTLTYSFVPDGTPLPSGAGEPASPSNLFAFLNGIYGSPAVWQPFYAGVFARWSQLTGITYVFEPNDDGAAVGSANPGVVGVRGDLRMAGHPIDGNSGVLAFNFFPQTGDMVIDTNDNFYTNTANNSIRLRNVLSHEHGHGMGLAHVCPILGQRLMEPFFNAAFDGPQHDDIRGAQFLYGDPSGANGTSGTATPLGAIANGQTRIVGQVPGVPVANGAILSIDRSADVDFFSFTVPAAGPLDVTVTPIGFNYEDATQSCSGATASCCSGTFTNSGSVGNLQFSVRAGDGTTVLASATAQPAGSPESVTDVPLASAGTYFVRVSASSITAGESQLYLLQLTFGNPCISDVDNGTGTGTPDGGTGIEDLLYYLAQFEAGNPSADVDDGTGTGTPDGGVGIEDLLYYLVRFEAGC